MKGINVVTLVGRLGADPEIKQGQDGSLFGTISVATNSTSKNAQGEYIENTDWHKVRISGNNAKFAAEYLSKGATVAITGSLKNRSYEKNGNKVYVTEVAASRLQGLKTDK